MNMSCLHAIARNQNAILRQWFLCGVSFVAGCTQAPSPNADHSQSAAAEPAAARGAVVYRISAADSVVHVLVYRGGALATLGHNHVLSSQDVAGTVWLHEQLELSGFALSVPVGTLIVDDDQARNEEGAEFPPQVPESAREGTKRNLLSEAVLDGAKQPRIEIRSVAIAGTREQPSVTARMTIKAQSRDIHVPVFMNEQGQSLRIRGEFDIKQSDFGIKPYSVALGALQVQDTVRIKFNLVAKRAVN